MNRSSSLSCALLRKVSAASALIVALAFCGSEATAQQKPQQPQGPQNALQGFSQNRDQPVKIQAAALEVRDKEKIATFSGDVHVVNGDTELRSKVLVVFYDEDPKAQNMKAADPGPGGEKSIKRIEAKGGVIVVQKDQIATGDSAVFNMRENIVTLVGNVVITKGENVLKGPRLAVDLTSGVSKMDGGPVSAVFDTRKPPDPKGGEKK
jgi:lipopolysaccharide export system protein LptA